MDQSIQISTAAAIIILVSVLILALFLRKTVNIIKASKNFRLPDPMPLTGIDVPIIGSYGGIKGWGLLAISENTINPYLTLYDDYMDYRVLVKKSVDYSQIKDIREVTIIFNSYIRFTFHDRSLTFGVRLINKEIMHEITDFFRARGIPIKGRRF